MYIDICYLNVTTYCKAYIPTNVHFSIFSVPKPKPTKENKRNVSKRFFLIKKLKKQKFHNV